MFADSEQPRFKVRSMYAENQEDHLMFRWPEKFAVGKAGARLSTNVSSLDLLDSPYARNVSQTENFAYVSQYKSIPAFTASLTMTLFENTTMAA